ncbi:putative ABC multidrug transporter [Penicillium brevicompactum]|uniref:ABC multidrug transporter n=1 Tax=Penicillium brevicompactum TaxID=5074 RepID=UPI0025414148|nr:ABC multidrug transporter [Penicillium brevicompactum]KAJ5326505.1 ABC multidrug transporter [Penicillium brevicompactum]
MTSSASPDEMKETPSSKEGRLDHPPDETNDTSISIDKETQEPIKTASLTTYLRILSYGARNGGVFAMVIGMICAMGSGIALPLMNIIFGKIVGDFNSYSLPDTAVNEHTFRSSINKSSLYIVYLFIGKFVLTYIAMICFRIISLYASAALRLEYTQSLFSMPISKLDQISVGTVSNAITAQSNTIQQSVSDRLAILFQSLALLVAAYAIAFRYSWALTLVVSSAILFVVICFCLTVPLLVKGQQYVDEADNKHASIAADAFGSIRAVLSLGAEGSLIKKHSHWIEEARRRGLRMSLVTGTHLATLFFAMYVSFALAFWFGLKLYREGHIANVNTVITVFFSVLLVVTVMGGIASPLMAISKAISASGAFFGVIDSEPAPLDGLRHPDVTSQADIVFENISFAYPTRSDTQVLKGFSACFPRGKTTALVGPSGSGKSTIVALIERWYRIEAQSEDSNEMNSGRILVDGHNINDLDVRWWRSQVGLVQQEPFLFNDTIYKNISYGLIGSKWENESEDTKLEMVSTACREAYADEFIERLPDRYSTMVGEGGITLSGGQRQRLAIARSIVGQPPILVLDEATSSIDVRGEKIVQAALDRVSKDRTTIMIAHRLSTVRRADNIVVMKDGACVEQGSHQELMDRGAVYHSLVNAQQLEPLDDDFDKGSEELLISQKEEIQPHDYPVDGEEEDEETPRTIKKTKSKGLLRSLGRVFYEHRSHWILYVLTIVSAIGAGSGYALQSWLFAQLIQVFQFTGQKLVDKANFWALMFFVLAIAMSTFYFLLGTSANTMSMHVGSSYRKDYFANTLKKPVSFYDREENSSGSLISRLSIDPKQIQDLLGPMGVFPLISIFNVIGCVAISFSFGWKLAAVTFFGAMPFILFAAFMRLRYETHFESMNAEVYADSSKFATEAIRAFRTVSALTMEKTIIDRYSGLLKEQRNKAFRKSWYATLIFAFSDSVELCAMALTFWYGGRLLASREYDPVAFFVVYIAIIQGGQAAGQFLSFGPNVAQAKASANRLFAAREPSEGQLESPVAEPMPKDLRPSVELRGVSFGYESRNITTFANLDISIESGQFVAFVGPSGCGKSTVISLLERFYDPTSGSILFGGRDISSIQKSSYRKALSLVAQEPKLFEGSIRDNLLLGIEDKEDAQTEERMIQACKDAEIHDFITSLPDGYLTELGVNAQTSLSGGQKQRLCIARALIRKPLLLLLDEATSSLDSHSEKLVQEAMERLAGKKNMTIIAVAHRLATIQKADVIFVFGEGARGRGSKILEKGSHHELLRNKGPYWQMCQAQALDR